MRSAFAVVAIALTALAALASPDDSGARKEIERAYDRMAAGFLKKDARPLIDVLAPGFTNAEPGGKPQSRKQFIESMKGYMAMTKSVDRSEIDVKKFTLKGGKAVADVRSVMKMTVDNSSGTFGKTGKTAVLEMDMMDRETWVNMKKRWLLKRSESLPGGKFLVNGKPAAMPGG